MNSIRNGEDGGVRAITSCCGVAPETGGSYGQCYRTCPKCGAGDIYREVRQEFEYVPSSAEQFLDRRLAEIEKTITERTQSMEAQEQAKYEGWAIVEIMGHRTIAGYVTTKYFGTAAMVHITQPDHPAQEKILERGQYVNGEYCDVGTKVRVSREKAEAYVGAASIYQLTVCSEEKALATQPVTIEIIEKVSRKQIGTVVGIHEDGNLAFSEPTESEGDF